MEDTRLESFPFDSKQAGYDDYGYPIYDRAVGASMLRQTFAKFFSNGVFDAPSNAMEISKGIGLKVNIAEGIAIINGAMASVPEGGISVSLADEATTSGTYAYGVFLRYDENSDKRSCYITVRKGEAGTSPAPPEPERSAPGIWELRLGYVVVPTGSSDLRSATVTNEKGLEYCPFALPFEEIDVSGITADFRTSANEALTALLDYFNQYEDMVDAAVDGTLAGKLQSQISELKEQLDNFDLSGSVDNKTIEYSTNEGEASKTLHVKKAGIQAKHLDENAAYENLQNASSSDFGKVKLFDGSNTEIDSESGIASTPKGVLAIMQEASENEISCASLGFTDPLGGSDGVINFTSQGVEQTGNLFERKSDRIVFLRDMVVVLSTKLTGSTSATKIKINGEEIAGTNSSSSVAEISEMLAVNKDDYMSIHGLPSGYFGEGKITDFVLRGLV